MLSLERFTAIREINPRHQYAVVEAGVLNADLGRGSISALIGLNGSGKTTLLRTLVKESGEMRRVRRLRRRPCGPQGKR